MTTTNKKNAVSDVLLSYATIAQEKGIISDSKVTEAAQKVASAPKKIDLIPSEDVNSNILRLCAGLRASGLGQHADSVERNFIAYKTAESSEYSAKDGGEDLIEMAHPEGSPKVEDAEDGHGVVENILKEHADLLKIVERDPNGKLSKAQKNEVIASVKLALAQSFPAKAEIEEFSKNFIEALTKFVIEPLKTDDYYNLELGGGKKVKNYYSTLGFGSGIDRIPDQFSALLAGFRTNAEIKFVLEIMDKYIKYVTDDLFPKLEEVVVNNPQLDRKLVRRMRAALAPHREAFGALWEKYHSRKSDSWHNQFIPASVIDNYATGVSAYLKTLVNHIDHYVLDDSTVKSNQPFKQWVEAQKAFILKRADIFLKLAEKAKAHELSAENEANKTNFAGLINLEVLKNLASQVDPTLLSDPVLKFGSLDEFKTTLSNYAPAMSGYLKRGITKAVSDPVVKEEMLKRFVG